MLKRIISLVLTLTLCLSMVPPVAFAEENAACICTEPCAEEVRNFDCPVCSAENALLTDCAQYGAAFEDSAIVASGECGADGDNLTWTLDEDGTLTISGTGEMANWKYQNGVATTPWYSYIDQIATVVIESGVTSIGGRAFYGCSSLTSITIPEGVTSIGDYAFFGCSSLTSITIPEGVTSIGNNAFSGCSSLTSITLPDSVTSIGSAAFYGCSSLTSITIPEGVTSIGNYAFYDCISLTSITIPAGVTSIGDYAFAECSRLTSIAIPEGVTSIGNYAFNKCCSLTSIAIPESVTTIGDYAFGHCNGLKSITISEGVTSIGECAFFVPHGSTGSYSLTRVNISDLTAWCRIDFSETYANPLYFAKNLYLNGELVTELVIPDEVTEIKHDVFIGADFLINVVIPESVTSIGERAFCDCSSLTSITIPDSVTSIEPSAFAGCSSLTSITIPEGVISIEYNVFSECNRLISLTIPEGVTSIGERAFYGCSNLTSINIPEGVTSIGKYAFYKCVLLTDVYYGGSEEQWKQIAVESYNTYLLSADIHYNSTGPESGSGEIITEVRNFYSWSENLQCVYFDMFDISGAVVTEETDTSFIENIPSLLGKYVLVSVRPGVYIPETMSITSETLLSITPLESKYGYIRSWDPNTQEVQISDVLEDGSADSAVTAYSLSEHVAQESVDLLTSLAKEELASIQFYLDSEGKICKVMECDIDVPDTPAEYRFEFSPDPLVVQTGEQFEITVSLYCNDELIKGWEPSGVSVTEGLSYVKTYQVDSGVCIVVSANKSGFGGVAVSYSTYGVDIFDTADVTVEDTAFNEYIYRVDYLLTNGIAQNLDYYIDYYNKYSPARIIVEDGRLGTATDIWTEFNTVMATFWDNPGEGVVKFAFDKIHVYEAIILNALDSTISTKDVWKEGTEDVLKTYKAVFNTLNTIIKTEYKWELSKLELSNASSKEIQELKEAMNSETVKSVADFSDLMDGLDLIMEASSTIEEMLQKMIEYEKLTQISETMVAVLDAMYQNTPDSLEYAAMRDALAFCRNTIQNSNYSDAALRAVTLTAGKFALQTGFNAIWENVEAAAEVACPGISVVSAAYKVSKTFMNNALGIDDIAEQTSKIYATKDYYDALNKSLRSLQETYKYDPTEKHARELLDGLTLLFGMGYTDCDTSIALCDASNKLDKTIWDQIKEVFRPKEEETNTTNLREYAEVIKSNTDINIKNAETLWISQLATDWPVVYPQYEYKLRFADSENDVLIVNVTRSVTVACPVDVYVYNSAGDVVASFCNGKVFATDILTAYQDGEVKHLDFYDDEEYRIECTGYGAGTMDIFVTEYDEGSIVREAAVHDLAVIEGTTYDLTTSANIGTYSVSCGNASIPMDYDSKQTSGETQSVHLKIKNGMFDTSDGPAYEIDVYPGQKIDISAYVPDDYDFLGWTSDVDGVSFEDVSAISSYVCAPQQDVTIIAEMQPNERHEHVYRDCTPTGSGSHTGTCLCGVTNTLDCSGGAATCTQQAICSSCNQPYGNLAEHSYKTEWNQGDENGHWHDCQNCDVHSNAEVHTPNVDTATEKTAKYCTICGYVIQEQLAHTHKTTKLEGFDATCTQTGQKTYYTCSCGTWFEDEAATTEITDKATVVIPALGHNYSDATCTAPKTCSCGATEGNALGHSYGTAWSKGEDSHWHECSGCGDKIDKTPHDFGSDGDKCVLCEYERSHVHRLTLVPAADATCTNAGSKAYYTCSGCEDWFEDSEGKTMIADKNSVIIEPKDHENTEWIQTVENHKKQYRCCGTVVIAEEPHEWEGGMCSKCGYRCQHIGGTATCTDKATCDTCGNEYGEKNADNHASTEYTYTDNENGTTHTKAHACCKVVANDAELHSYENGKCVCGAVEPAGEPEDREYVQISVEVAGTATATQNGLSLALSDEDIMVMNADLVSVTMNVTKKTSGGSSGWGSWFGSWWGNSNSKTTYDHTITFEGKIAGTTTVQVGDVLYKVTVTEPHVHNHIAVVTAPTCTEKGYTTYTCECDNSYVSDYMDALGHDYQDGICGTCGEAEPVKPSTFTPKSFTASLSSSSVNVGKSVTITVKTSTDVEYVTINGVKVTTYKDTTSGGWVGWSSRTTTRTFTYTVNESKAGTYEYEVYAFNADGAQSNTVKTLTLKIAESSGGSGSSWWNWWK